jgi:hypothetical protein
MSIHFSCELTDPDTEALLNFLEKLTGNDEGRMLTVLDCAKDWLKLEAPIQSHRGDAHVKSSLVLVADQDDSSFVEPSRMPVLSQQA